MTDQDQNESKAGANISTAPALEGKLAIGLIAVFIVLGLLALIGLAGFR